VLSRENLNADWLSLSGAETTAAEDTITEGEMWEYLHNAHTQQLQSQRGTLERLAQRMKEAVQSRNRVVPRW
jgi:predicted NUDIX family NTP pyrophosphohydrolase